MIIIIISTIAIYHLSVSFHSFQRPEKQQHFLHQRGRILYDAKSQRPVSIAHLPVLTFLLPVKMPRQEKIKRKEMRRNEIRRIVVHRSNVVFVGERQEEELGLTIIR